MKIQKRFQNIAGAHAMSLQIFFFSKTLTYPYLGEKDGLQAAINELSRSFRKHRHEEDRADGISPRTTKYALYEGELYPYGLCEVKLS